MRFSGRAFAIAPPPDHFRDPDQGVQDGAVRVCLESLARDENGAWRKFCGGESTFDEARLAGFTAVPVTVSVEICADGFDDDPPPLLDTVNERHLPRRVKRDRFIQARLATMPDDQILAALKEAGFYQSGTRLDHTSIPRLRKAYLQGD